MSVYATGLTGTIGSFLPDSVKPINIDLSSNADEFAKLKFKKSDIIIHLGAVVGNRLVEENYDYAYKVNVRGTRLLAEVALTQEIAKFFYISSSHVYKSKTTNLLEYDDLEASTPYAMNKLDAERQLENIFRQQRSKLVILRVFSILDWGMPSFTLGGALEQALQDKEVLISNGDDIRDFLTPKLVAKILYNLTFIKDLPQVINICSGIGTSVALVAEIMLKNMNNFSNVIISPGVSEKPIIIGNNKILRKLLPEISLSFNPTFLS